MPPRDTSPEAEAMQLERLRSMTGAQRFAIAVEMSDMARGLALARLRCERPDASEAELRKELLRIAFAPGELPPALR